jgi:two-component system, response regulator
LPAPHSTPTSAKPQPAAVNLPPTTSKLSLIVIIDDSSDDLMLLRRALQKTNVADAIFTFERPSEALAYLQSVEPFQPLNEGRATVLCDLKMPQTDGFEVLRRIRARPGLAPLRVIMISGCALEDDVERARQLGADGYIEKMPASENLVASVRNPYFPATGTRPQRFKIWEDTRG